MTSRKTDTLTPTIQKNFYYREKVLEFGIKSQDLDDKKNFIDALERLLENYQKMIVTIRLRVPKIPTEVYLHKLWTIDTGTKTNFLEIYEVNEPHETYLHFLRDCDKESINQFLVADSRELKEKKVSDRGDELVEFFTSIKEDEREKSRERQLCVFDEETEKLYSPFSFFLVSHSGRIIQSVKSNVDTVPEDNIIRCIEIYANEMKRRILDLQTRIEAELDLDSYFLERMENEN